MTNYKQTLPNIAVTITRRAHLGLEDKLGDDHWVVLRHGRRLAQVVLQVAV